MYKIIQFSPTGNAAYIANQLGNALQIETKIDALEHACSSEVKEIDHLIIVFAIHGFNAPKTVKRFVRQLPVNVVKKVSLIGVGCNNEWLNDGVTKDLRKELEKKNAVIIVDKIVAMPLTFIMSFPEELIKQQILDAKNTINDIAKQIKNNVVSYNTIKFKAHALNFVGKAEPFAARFFGLELHAKKNCTSCGLCVRECPEKNIRMDDKSKIHFKFNCIMCMRCIYNCPEKAIAPRISRFIPIKNGYNLKPYIEDDSENNE